MNCSDVHLSLGAEPGTTSPELEAHLHVCAGCAEYRREMLQLDDRIRRALMIDAAASVQSFQSETPAHAAPWARGAAASAGAGAAASSSSFSRGRQWALAASLLIGVFAVLVMWGALPRHSLAADVVSHVLSETIDEPLEGPVAETAVREVMEQSGLRLDPIDPGIVFVRTCFLRGRLVPHFIVRTDRGMATVIVLPDEPVSSPERFAGNGYKGLLIPDSEKGSIAVLSRSEVDVERYATEIRRAVHSLPAKTGS